MKNLIILIFCFFAFNSFANSTIMVDVLSAEFGVEDYDQRKTLCLTTVRLPKCGKLLGVVESMEDCFYTRQAKKSGDHKLNLALKDLKKIDHPQMREHLQRLDPLLEFYYSDGE